MGDWGRSVLARRAIIIGAGPAGLTAALELLRQTDVVPLVLEATDEIGGISRTIRYKGNRMDIGGHRFFSKSDRVMQWWMDLMPPEVSEAETEQAISYQGKQRVLAVPARLSAGAGAAGRGADPDSDGDGGRAEREERPKALRQHGHTETIVVAPTVAET